MTNTRILLPNSHLYRYINHFINHVVAFLQSEIVYTLIELSVHVPRALIRNLRHDGKSHDRTFHKNVTAATNTDWKLVSLPVAKASLNVYYPGKSLLHAPTKRDFFCIAFLWYISSFTKRKANMFRERTSCLFLATRKTNCQRAARSL